MSSGILYRLFFEPWCGWVDCVNLVVSHLESERKGMMFTRQKEKEFVETAKLVMKGVREEMKKQGITQKRMSNIWGVSEPTISKKLAGYRRTTLMDLLKFCDVLNISPAVLFPGGTEYTVHNISIGELIQVAVKREVTKLFKEREWVE